MRRFITIVFALITTASILGAAEAFVLTPSTTYMRIARCLRAHGAEVKRYEDYTAGFAYRGRGQDDWEWNISFAVYKDNIVAYERYGATRQEMATFRRCVRPARMTTDRFTFIPYLRTP